MIIHFFHLHVFYVIFNKIVAKNKELIFFLTQGSHHSISLFSYIIKLTCFNH